MWAENEEAIAAWDGVLFDKFCRFRPLVTTALAEHGNAAMDRLAPPVGSRVLDLGCGFGDTTRQLAARVGAGGEAVGIDAARRFIELATREAAQAGVSNVRFLVGDVQLAELEGPYDCAFSRFGTMFFASPVAALHNVARALRPGGRLAMAVWRRKDRNEWLHRAEEAVLRLVAPPERSDEPTCGPGPFSMADPELVGEQLSAAGFTEISFERFDAAIRIGRDLDEAVEFAMQLGPAGEILRLAGEEGERRRPEVVAALRSALGGFLGPAGVVARSASWIVQGRS
jgi:ubiquinone/menaquinone biosynthesis C-methylase UbiE